jgi:spore coat polysaccharide biosynthesis protein SpsF
LVVDCFRGSEDDVLGRIAGAVREFGDDVNVAFMADNPVPDPPLIDSIVGFYLKHVEYDYVTNTIRTTYSPGLEVMVYGAKVLIDADIRCTDFALREHVGPNSYQHPERYRIHNIEAPPWFNFPDLHLEVDVLEDFELVATIYEHCYRTNPGFGLQEVIDFTASRPELTAWNQDIPRRWKAYRQDDH